MKPARPTSRSTPSAAPASSPKKNLPAARRSWTPPSLRTVSPPPSHSPSTSSSPASSTTSSTGPTPSSSRRGPRTSSRTTAVPTDPGGDPQSSTSRPAPASRAPAGRPANPPSATLAASAPTKRTARASGARGRRGGSTAPPPIGAARATTGPPAPTPDAVGTEENATEAHSLTPSRARAPGMRCRNMSVRRIAGTASAMRRRRRTRVPVCWIVPAVVPPILQHCHRQRRRPRHRHRPVTAKAEIVAPIRRIAAAIFLVRVPNPRLANYNQIMVHRWRKVLVAREVRLIHCLFFGFELLACFYLLEKE
mmetsp:Transcript_13150/g.27930  ORF Transcript_13150/g.27930 Transcript_13150/m.27930 type:complete len:308 (-) Transcript_13150:164-1087(-)